MLHSKHKKPSRKYNNSTTKERRSGKTGNYKNNRDSNKRYKASGNNKNNGNSEAKNLRKFQNLRDKYLDLAKEAATSGDRVEAEIHSQHADHFFRMIQSISPDWEDRSREDRSKNRRENNDQENKGPGLKSELPEGEPTKSGATDENITDDTNNGKITAEAEDKSKVVPLNKIIERNTEEADQEGEGANLKNEPGNNANDDTPSVVWSNISY